MKLKHLTFSFLGVILIVLLASAQISQAIVPNELEEGQEFTFSVDEYSYDIKVNGTNYADPTKYRSGDTVDVVVDNIGEDSTYTFVDVTETLDEETSETTSYMDDWYSYFLIGVFFVAFGTFGFPDFTSFDEPTNTDGIFDATDSLIPFFANSNETFYDELDLEFESVDDDLETDDPEAFTTYTVNSNADYNSDDQIFTLTFNWHVANTTETSDGTTASFDLSSAFDLEIDVSRSVVTKLISTTSILLKVGSEASLEYGLDIQVSEGGGFFGFVSGLPSPGIYLSILALFLAVPIVRRRQ